MVLVQSELMESSSLISMSVRQKRSRNAWLSCRWTTSNTRSPSCSSVCLSRTSLQAPLRRSWESTFPLLLKAKWQRSWQFLELSKHLWTSKSKINAKLPRSLLGMSCSKVSMHSMSSIAIQRRWGKSEMRSYMTRGHRRESATNRVKLKLQALMALKI